MLKINWEIICKVPSVVSSMLVLIISSFQSGHNCLLLLLIPTHSTPFSPCQVLLGVKNGKRWTGRARLCVRVAVYFVSLHSFQPEDCGSSQLPHAVLLLLKQPNQRFVRLVQLIMRLATDFACSLFYK